MRLGGLQKNSTLDFPGALSAVLFTQGCNFTCPYCHNPELLRPFGLPVEEEAALEFLRKRRPLLDAVVMSGGEPTLQPDLAEFCLKLKGLGYAVKLDTNGSRPEVLADLIERGVLDYVALDLKADPRHYPREIVAGDIGSAIMESVAILKRGRVLYEFRCTAAAPFVTIESIVSIAEVACGEAPLFLQRPRLEKILSPEFMLRYIQPGPGELEELRHMALPFTPNCFIR